MHSSYKQNFMLEIKSSRLNSRRKARAELWEGFDFSEALKAVPAELSPRHVDRPSQSDEHPR